jgi:hypothetical protein
MVQTDHFEITVLATSRTIDVRKLSLLQLRLFWPMSASRQKRPVGLTSMSLDVRCWGLGAERKTYARGEYF